MAKKNHNGKYDDYSFDDEDLEGFLRVDKKGRNRAKRKNQKFAIEQIKDSYREGFADEDEINDFFSWNDK